MNQKRIDLYPHRETLVDKIVDNLEKRILSGEIPPNTKLSEMKVAFEFNVSRVPAREALNRLEDMGLLEKNHLGRWVKALKLEEFREIYNLKNVVEAYCAMQGAINATEKDHQILKSLLDEMKKNLSSKNKKKLRKLNIKFHDYILNCSQNKKFIEVYQSQLKKVRFVSTFALEMSDRPKIAFKEHCDILNAFIEGDGKKVRMLMENHKDRHMEFILKLLTKKKVFV